MKLDKDAIRAILLAVEADNGSPMMPKQLKISDLSDEEISYHVHLLAEAGYVDAANLRSFQFDDWKPKRLTFAGHEYLDTVRDNEIWRLTKEGAKEVGASSVSMLFEIGKAIVKQKAIEHGIHL